MSSFIASVVVVPASLALIRLGGALYEFSVVDPFWPRRPEIIQPGRGGISRRRFWIPVHTAFELALLAALVVTWSLPDIRFWLLVALLSHAVMRIWSFIDFVPKAQRQYPARGAWAAGPFPCPRPRHMTMIAYAFLQHRRLASRAGKNNPRAATSAQLARRAKCHRQPNRSTASAMPALPEIARPCAT